MGFSLDYDNARDDWGMGLFGGGSTTAERIKKRINQYTKTYGTDSKLFQKASKRLDYFAAGLEKRIARRIGKGKEDTDKTRKLQSLLDMIYKTTNPLGDTSATGGISRGAARENAEGRAATIYLGGYSSRLGIQTPTAPTIPGAGGGAGGGGGVGRPNRGPARSFLGQYYGGGQLGSHRSRGQIP